jgi:hypothetical protein
MGSSAGAQANVEFRPQPQPFRFFISYAREDYNIAIAVSNAIQTATGPAANVFMDIALPFGVSFEEEIKTRLDETNVLVVINSAVLKSAFSYPGLELGYFIRVMESDKRPEFPRRIVPIYLEKPPDAVVEKQGVNIGISRTTLNMTVPQYTAGLQTIDFDDSAVRLLRELQNLVDGMRERQHLARISQNQEQQNLPGIVMTMKLAIFNHLKTTQDWEATLKPQLQITLNTSDDALSAFGEDQLPDDALLIPVGTGKPMSIFGLQNVNTTWGAFRQPTSNRFLDSWIDAITKVVWSSLKNQLQIDNSQVIVSYDALNAYRVILTTGTRYFNGNREFNIYFVEVKHQEYGDRGTTLLLKGLELVCRFRSLFLERESEYSATVSKLARPEAVKEFAVNMDHELNLMRRDALGAKLDKAEVWLGLIDTELIVQLSQAWRPLESRIRDAIANIRRSDPATVEGYQNSLTATLEELETKMRPINGQMIAAMAEKLKEASPAIG